MRALLLALALPLAGCGEGSPPLDPDPTIPPFPLRPVVAERIAALEAAVAGESGSAEPGPDEVEAARAEIEGLLDFLGEASGGMREAALEDARRLGQAAVPRLAEVLADAQEQDGRRQSAAELLGAIASPAASAALLEQVQFGEPPWLRAHAAWHLGRAGADEAIPRLVLRTKYERDWETFIWVADALAKRRNYAGLEGLLDVWRNGATDALRATAEERLRAIAADAGATDVAELARGWDAADAGEALGIPKRSARWQLEVWRWTARLSEYQLRGVDDARFMLARLAPEGAQLLAEALHEENPYIRSHVAQALQRMGARGRSAGPTLVAGLADPELAPFAAAALGAVGYGGAASELTLRLAPSFDLGLRVACARALGPLGDASAVEPLRARLAEGEPLELRQAAAESLALLGAGDSVARFLCGLLEDERVEPASSQAALRHWIAARAEAGSEAAEELLVDWDAVIAAPEGEIATSAQRAAALARRVELLRSRFDTLLGTNDG